MSSTEYREQRTNMRNSRASLSGSPSGNSSFFVASGVNSDNVKSQPAPPAEQGTKLTESDRLLNVEDDKKKNNCCCVMF